MIRQMSVNSSICLRVVVSPSGSQSFSVHSWSTVRSSRSVLHVPLVRPQFAYTGVKHVASHFSWYNYTGGYFNGNGYLRSQYGDLLVLGILFHIEYSMPLDSANITVVSERGISLHCCHEKKRRSECPPLHWWRFPEGEVFFVLLL
jgi:hypothetical protein